MAASLIIQTGKLKGRKLNLPNTEIIIGRDEDCAIRLSVGEISRKHCVLRSTSEGLFIKDLGSSNGTLVNDIAITTEVELDHGDTIQVGSMLFQVADLEPPPKAVEPKPKEAKPDKKISDDDIADWLADGPSDAGSGSTTVIRKDSPAYAAIQAANEESAKVKRRNKFSSVAEEGRDIIRRHFESLKGGK